MKKVTKLKILKVWTETVVDSDGDFSYLGMFTDKVEPYNYIREGDHAGKFIFEIGDEALPTKCREKRFIEPGTNHVPHNPKNWEKVASPELVEVVAKYGSIENADIEYARQDCQRLENLGKTWDYVGIIAKAEVWNPQTQTTQTLRSGGLWGIESDSDKEYLVSVQAEELAGLKAELLALGFGERACDHALKQSVNINK